MGRVVLAHDPVLERAVAVKLLRDDLGLPPEQRRALIDRMRHEARASARVSHPNIVALHDMGEDGDVGLYLVFEYVEGPTLKERLLHGALGPEAAARLARELGDALSTAHSAGVLHRDIKPENVILARTGSKIADFGIARVPDSTLTRDGGLLGTPAYSAPEAISQGQFSPLSDQFSLATTLYEAIVGRRAFPGDDAVSVATRIATEEPPRIAQICRLDPHVDTVLARALSKVPGSRFPSCEDFGRALAEALQANSSRASMATLPDRQHVVEFQRSSGASRAVAIALGGAAAAGLLIVGTLKVAEALRPPTTSPDTVVTIATAAPTTAGSASATPEPPDTPTAPSRRLARRSSAVRVTDATADAGANAASPRAAAGDGASEIDAGSAPHAVDAGVSDEATSAVGRP